MNILDTITMGLLDRKIKAYREIIAPKNITDMIRVTFVPDNYYCDLVLPESRLVSPITKEMVETGTGEPTLFRTLKYDAGSKNLISLCGEEGIPIAQLNLDRTNKYNQARHDQAHKIVYTSLKNLFNHFEAINFDDNETGILFKWIYQQLDRREWNPQIERNKFGIADHYITNKLGLELFFDVGRITIKPPLNCGVLEPDQHFDLNDPESLTVFENYLDKMSDVIPKYTN